MSKNRTQYIWKYLHVKTKLVFNSLSFSFDSLAHGEDSSVHHINRYWFQCSPDSCRKGSKIFWVICRSKASWRNLRLAIWKIFSIGFKSRLLAGIVNFRAPTSSQADLAFTLLCQGSPSCRKSLPLGLAVFLNMLVKYSRANEENFSAFILPWYCSAVITPLAYAIAAIKWPTFSPVPSWLPYPVKPKSNPCPGFLQTVALGALVWSKGFILCVKTCSIQIESYTSLPKVCRKFTMNFSSKLKPQFQVVFGQDSFPLSTSPFQTSLSQNSVNCLLTNGW